MWMLLSRRTQLFIVVSLTVLAVMAWQGIAEFVAGTAPSHLGPIKLISPIVLILGTFMAAAANAGWRRIWRVWPILGKLLYPDMNGTWRGVLQSTWKDVDGNTLGPIAITITIRQSLFAISVHQETGESPSWSTRVFPEADPDAGRYRLWYAYDNTPKAGVSHRSHRHEGVAILDFIPDGEPETLNGRYYTSRQTSGDIRVKRVSPF